MKIGYIGLGKMGLNMCLQLQEHGHKVVAFNRGESGRARGRSAGLLVADSLEDLVAALPSPKVLWLMVSHGGVDDVLRELAPMLSRGDIVVDGGNCFYEDTVKRAKLLKKRGIKFLDAGVSGGPGGARSGACLMIGGDRSAFEKLTPIFKAVSAADGFRYLGGHGAGHFAKMVHNGIEYGMMQSLAEGFAILKTSPFRLKLKEVADLYNRKSVIESRLVGWLSDAFEKFGPDLKVVSGSVAHTGEGEWTVKTAKKLKVPAEIIEKSLRFRMRSAKDPSYTGKILSALRNQFGGHDANSSK